MPFALRVSSHLHSYVLPLSPCNYNALYCIISRLSFSLDPGGVSRCVPRRPGGVHLYALHRGNVAAVWMARYIYAAAWCSLAVLNAARAAGAKYMYLLRVWRNYINIFIYYAKPSKIRTFCDLPANGRFARKRAAFGGVLRADGASLRAACIVAVWLACGPC